MEVRPGYKQTEVGLLPEEWEMTPFAELFEFRNGVNADKASYGQGVRFINVLEPITYSHIYGPEITGQVTLPEPVATSYAVRRGDVLFNRTSETQDEVGLAATYLGTERVVFGGFVIRGRPINQSLDPIYSGYALRAPIIRSQIIPMGQGAIRANIGQQNLSLVVAPVPPLPEQRAIAAALSDVDALLEGLTRLIAKKRDLKQAAMQQLLTGQTRLPSFSGEWEVKRVGELAKIQRGASPRPIDSPVWFDENSSIGWVRISDVTCSGMFLYETTQRLSPLGVKHSRPVATGSLIMSICATVGRPIITRIDVCIHDGFVVFDNLDADQLFVYYVLKWIEPDWTRHGQTGSQMNLNTGLINGKEIKLPPRDEQTAIAAVLSDMDAELSALLARRDKTRDLKQAMMQELLTGRIRLV